MADSSPLPTSPAAAEPERKILNFYEALLELRAGRKITRVNWNDMESYGVLVGGSIRFHKTDKTENVWEIHIEDMDGADWFAF